MYQKAISLLFTICLFFSTTIFSQTEAERANADAMAEQAINLMDNGDYKESIKLLKKCIKMVPDDWGYTYELAYAYDLSGNDAKALKISKPLLTDFKDVNYQCYQLVGNLYEVENKYSLSLKTYNKGIKLFPDAGPLYLEKGFLEYFRLDQYEKGLATWELGIEKDPSYASNYYWASRVYLASEDEIWGLLYGEIFMNIEPGTKRTAEISSLLLETYKENILIGEEEKSESKKKSNEEAEEEEEGDDLEIKITLSKNMTMELPKEGEKLKFPFPMTYELALASAAALVAAEKGKSPGDAFTVTDIKDIRTKLIEVWYSDEKYHKEYPNVLLDHLKMLQEEGHWDMYNRWLIAIGDRDDYADLVEGDKTAFDEFADWYNENKIEITTDNYFHKDKKY